MKAALLAVAACALLAACGGPDRPAPGQPPTWPQPSGPRASDSLPVPMRDQYLPTSAHQIRQLPPVAEGENVPYAVRGQTQQLPKVGGEAEPELNSEKAH